MRVCVSCVVDNNPVFRMQSLNFLSSIHAFLPNCDIRFNLIGEHPDSYVQDCQSQGVTIDYVRPFGDNTARYCNKLRQLAIKEFRTYDLVMLCDTDTFFLDNPSHLFDSSVIQAKYVDTGTPDLAVLHNLFSKAGVSCSTGDAFSTHTGESIVQHYCNGGFYLIPGAFFDTLGPKWINWAHFCLEELPSSLAHFSDQVAFSLAMAECKLPFRPLPAVWNYPIHFHPSTYNHHPAEPLGMIHYHNLLDNGGYIIPRGVDFIDEAVSKANAVMQRYRQLRFNNAVYWDYRYTAHTEIGSGVGSRGDYLMLKRKILYPMVSLFRDKKILDVGCGDLEVMWESDAKDYTGLDTSSAALTIAQQKRADWKFLNCDVRELECRYDLSLCIDVLIHIPTREAYRKMVSSILDYTTDTAIFAAFDSAPSVTSAVCFFHEPITYTLRRDPRVGAITVIGSYRDVTIVMAERKKHKPVHSADIPLYTLAKMLVRTPYQKTAHELVELSRSSFGFYTRTPTRLLEYPWIARTALVPAGKRILDIGAGISPLPLWFSRQQAHVVTVDMHKNTFTYEDLPWCNEWGFFDYSCLDKTITSYNIDAKDISEDPFDILYSCSAIEHIPRVNRIENITAWYTFLKPGGQLLLTVDLVPHTRRLWNYCEGNIVEAPAEHGTLEDLINELEHAGFTIHDIILETECFLSRTDVVLINAFRSR